MPNDKLVIIPTYNEIENIQSIIEAVMELKEQFHILVVDDNSPDGTGIAVKKLMETYPSRLYILERSGKQGLGKAYLAGFDWALQRDYGYIFEMDADFSHNPKDLSRLLDACKNEGADVAIGSRYCNGVNVVNWPLSRILMSYCASIYVRAITGMHVKDSTAGFVCYKKEVLETIRLNEIHFKGYAFQIEMKYTALLSGFKLKEVPIIFVNREKGSSKMNSSIFGEALMGVIKLKYWGITRKYPQRKD